MKKAGLLTAIGLPKKFTDVLYLTNEQQMPPEIKRLLRKRKLSYKILPADKFFQLRDRLDLIGTVIIETESMSTSQEENLARIIESLEMEKIGVILITERARAAVKSFSLAPKEKSFSMTGAIESVSIDELWVRISVNLAYRKKSSGMAVRPAIPPKQMQTISKNRLAAKLDMTGEMVDSLAEELRLAGLVQQDFLPTNLPTCDKLRWATVFLPTEWVSGDIYDVQRIDEHHVGFYVADVVGHGVPAALLTIFLKQAIVMRETFQKNYSVLPPAEVMKNVNMRMSTQKLSGYQFATCCYCLINTNTLQLTYSRAGHPYPILIRHQEQPQYLEIEGPLVGIFEQAKYHQQTIQLEPGDKLLLYSDGALPFISNTNDTADTTSLNFSDEFLEIIDRPIVEMMDKFNVLAENKEIDPSGIDDVTAIGLEVI